LAEHFEHLWRPISAGVAVPLFALCSAGVAIGGLSGLQSALTDPIAIGIIVAKIAVLTGSGTAALLTAVQLRIRNRRYKIMCAEEDATTTASPTSTNSNSRDGQNQ
jgi:Na+/H+ antiporter NhaA